MATSDDIQKLYIAYFGRPADPAGLAFYVEGNFSLEAMISAFSGSAESQALYGNMSPDEQVTAIYRNLFGRDPEPAGLAFWVNGLATGQFNPAQMALTVLQSAQSSDGAVIANKVTAANAFTASLDTPEEVAGYAGNDAAASARGFLTKIDASPASIANLDRDVAAAVGDATGTGTPLPPIDPGPSAPVFSAGIVDGVVTIATAGSAIAVTEENGDFTFVSSGGVSGAVTLEGPVTDIKVPAGSTLTISTALATGLGFPGPGAVALSEVGPMTAADLMAFEAAIAGWFNARAITDITGASVSDAVFLLATKNGTAGDTVGFAANVGVELTGTSERGGDLLAIADATTGVVDAASITEIIDLTLAGAHQLLITDAATVLLKPDVNLILTDTTARTPDITAIALQTDGYVGMLNMSTLIVASAQEIDDLWADGGLMLPQGVVVKFTATSATAQDLISTSRPGQPDLTGVEQIAEASVDDAHYLLVSRNYVYTFSGDVAVTVVDTAAHGGHLADIVRATTGTVDVADLATLTICSVADALFLLVEDHANFTPRSDIAVTLADLYATGAELRAIAGATTGDVNAEAITQITNASAADAVALLGDDSFIRLGDVKVILTDTSITAANLRAIAEATTGIVYAEDLLDITAASIADATYLLANGAEALAIRPNVNVTLTDTSATADDLIALVHGNLLTVDGSSLTEITVDTGMEAATLLRLPNLELGDDVEITILDTTISEGQFDAILSATPGDIDLPNLLTINATAAEAERALVTESDRVSRPGHVSVYLSDTSASAASLTAILGATEGNVVANALTDITAASMVDAQALLADSTFMPLAGVKVTLASGSASASELTALASLAEAVTGTVDGSAISQISGSRQDFAVLLTHTNLTLSSAYAITLEDATADASALMGLLQMTTGNVAAPHLQSLSSLLNDATYIVLTEGQRLQTSGTFNLALTDTTARAEGLLALIGSGRVSVSAENLTDITHATIADAVYLLQALLPPSRTDINVTLTEVMASAASLLAVGGLTAGDIATPALLEITGSVADITALLADATFTHLGGVNVTLTNAEAYADQLAVIAGATTGVVDASAVPHLVGYADELAQLVSRNDVTLAGDFQVTTGGIGTTDAADLRTIAEATTGRLYLLTFSQVQGWLADAKAFFVTDGQWDSGTSVYHLSLRDTTASAADLMAFINAGLITLSVPNLTDITDASVYHASELLHRFNNSGLYDFNVTLTEYSASAADLLALDSRATGLISSDTIAQVTGTIAEVQALMAIPDTQLELGGLVNLVLTDGGGTLVMTDAFVPQADSLTFGVDGSALSASSPLVFDGSRETQQGFHVSGGAGADSITGSNSSDVIIGGAGEDTLVGLRGLDYFVYQPGTWSTFHDMDVINDYAGSGNDQDYLIVDGITATISDAFSTVLQVFGPSLAVVLDGVALANDVQNGLIVFTWNDGNSIDTYVYIETVGSGNAYASGDFVVKLAGTPFAAGASVSGLGIDGL